MPIKPTAYPNLFPMPLTGTRRRRVIRLKPASYLNLFLMPLLMPLDAGFLMPSYPNLFSMPSYPNLFSILLFPILLDTFFSHNKTSRLSEPVPDSPFPILPYPNLFKTSILSEPVPDSPFLNLFPILFPLFPRSQFPIKPASYPNLFPILRFPILVPAYPNLFPILLS
ncbi:MAG: hypothetical protein GY807_06980, partial [Gammaproteobacteria bacterium]|nr:hypothetical protein [Gammaproteobacteria bacterium]